MADAVVTGETSSSWEWANDLGSWAGNLVGDAVNGYFDVEKEKAKNPEPSKELGNTANPSGTLTEAKQSQTAPTAINPTWLYVGGGIGIFILLIVLVLAFRSK